MKEIKKMSKQELADYVGYEYAGKVNDPQWGKCFMIRKKSTHNYEKIGYTVKEARATLESMAMREMETNEYHSQFGF